MGTVPFVPRIEAVTPGVIRFHNDGFLGKFLSATLRHDSTCGLCGELFQAGDEIQAHLAADPDAAVWEHKRCAS